MTLNNILKTVWRWVGRLWRRFFPKSQNNMPKTTDNTSATTYEPEMSEPTSTEPIESNNDKLYRIADALAQLEKDITPEDAIDDEVACVQNLCEVINQVVDFPKLAYTPYLVTALKEDSRFKGTLDLKAGHIIVNATESGNGAVRGHTGILGKDEKIMSGNSYNGKWEYNYDIESWTNRFRRKGEMPTLVFKLLD